MSRPTMDEMRERERENRINLAAREFADACLEFDGGAVLELCPFCLSGDECEGGCPAPLLDYYADEVNRR